MAKVSRLSNNKRRQLQQLIAQAAQAYQSQGYDMCETLCKRIEAIHPGDADVAHIRGGMCLNIYGIDEALPFFLAAAKAAPKRIEFHINLGRVCLQRGEYLLAFEAYSNAVNIQAGNLFALLGCCRALIGLGRFSEAEDYLRLTRGKPLHLPDEFIQKSAACADLNHADEAFSLLDELLQRFPDYAHGYFQKAVALLQAGDKTKAGHAIDKVLELQPYHAKALSLMADVRTFESCDDPKIKMILNAVEHGQPNQEEMVLLNIGLGKAMQKVGKYDDAFGYFSEANEVRARNSSYDPDREMAYLEAMARSFTPAVFAQAASPLQDETPIFVVGMPRCGSTLTEQILVAHPRVSGRGEINLFEPALDFRMEADGVQTIEGMASFSPEQWAQVGNLYLERLKLAGPVSRYITDKSLDNIRMLGAIHCALPHAKIIHVCRHPLDTCLSIYTSSIRGSSYDYGLRLETLGQYYLQYMKLMKHWRDVLPQDVFYELNYEEMVSRQEEQTRGLLDFCGLEWDVRCMQFERSEQRVKTASIMQVRQAMNTRSVERWRYYERHLQPLIDLLGIE